MADLHTAHQQSAPPLGSRNRGKLIVRMPRLAFILICVIFGLLAAGVLFVIIGIVTVAFDAPPAIVALSALLAFALGLVGPTITLRHWRQSALREDRNPSVYTPAVPPSSLPLAKEPEARARFMMEQTHEGQLQSSAKPSKGIDARIEPGRVLLHLNATQNRKAAAAMIATAALVLGLIFLFGSMLVYGTVAKGADTILGVAFLAAYIVALVLLFVPKFAQLSWHHHASDPAFILRSSIKNSIRRNRTRGQR